MRRGSLLLKSSGCQALSHVGWIISIYRQNWQKFWSRKIWDDSFVHFLHSIFWIMESKCKWLLLNYVLLSLLHWCTWWNMWTWVFNWKYISEKCVCVCVLMWLCDRDRARLDFDECKIQREIALTGCRCRMSFLMILTYIKCINRLQYGNGKRWTHNVLALYPLLQHFSAPVI